MVQNYPWRFINFINQRLKNSENNPYQLVYDVKGIGFQKADTLARNNGIAYNDSERLKAGLLYTLEEECIKQGHTYLDENAVLEITEDMLSDKHLDETIEQEQLKHVLQTLLKKRKLF